MKYLMPAALLSALALTGCGGASDNVTGGGSTTPAAQGIWSGSIESVTPTRDMSMLVLKSGQLWAVYTKQGSSAVGGALWANSASPNGSTYIATSPIDIYLDLPVTASINLASTSLVAGSKFWGSYNIVGSSTVNTFKTTYNNTTTAPTIVGTFTGTTGTKAGISLAGSEALTLTINTGSSTMPNIVGTSASGCTVSGSILPLSGTAAYVVDLTFSGSGSACANGTGSASEVVGVAFVDSASSKLNIMALNLPATTKGFVFRN